ncbi:hypothetical protein F5144DRAFT_396684 [Chaetomium tenue]|uniref:Uncharacterized protein n=1 Tax=Chaetomium tenue TaxID=1854479 RepID=A0ACB7NW22_9PEZI|nr:hypothetical protein F5144DRAFT_396684 [Chaetomium globosum]
MGGVRSLVLGCFMQAVEGYLQSEPPIGFSQTPALIAAVETHVESSSPWPGVAANLDGIYLLEIRILFSYLQKFLPTRCVRLNHYILYQAQVLLAFSHSFFFGLTFARPLSFSSDKTLWAHIPFETLEAVHRPSLTKPRLACTP